MKPRRTDARLSAAQVDAAYRLYQSGLSVNELALRGWQAWGFASVASANRSLRHAFRKAGLALRTYRQAWAVAHPPAAPKPHWKGWHGEGVCQGRVKHYMPAARGGAARVGTPCRRRVQRGQRFCSQHDPQRAAERAARLARARAARA